MEIGDFIPLEQTIHEVKIHISFGSVGGWVEAVRAILIAASTPDLKIGVDKIGEP